MRELVPLVFLTVAGLLLAVALYFLLRAWRTRRAVRRAAYGFGQVENLKAVRVDLLRSGAVALLGLLLGLIGLLLPALGANEVVPGNPTATSTPAVSPAGDRATPSATPPASPFPTVGLPSATPTSPLPTLTPSPTPTQTATPSATPLPTAIVVSPNGLYLRDVPGGSAELELIRDGAVLTLLGETAEADALTWVRVRTTLGNVGWVAADFISPTTP